MSDHRADRSGEQGLKPERVQKQPAGGRLEAEQVQDGAATESEEPAVAAEGGADAPTPAI